MQSPSPLRYPGGKAKLFPYINRIIQQNNLLGSTYIEPFAGGCGLAIGLLQKGLVGNIIINDYDYAIYAFWYSILENSEEFCERIREIEVTIEEWDIQKDIYLHQEEHTIFEVGFSTFFLNRTNRSGILNGGIIGGRAQQSKYTIDCRFNRKALIGKIERIAAMRERIQVFNLDVFEFIEDNLANLPINNTFVYFDPPYVKKGQQLYKNFFDFQDHTNLKESIVQLNHRWLTTYDHVDEIAILYEDFQQDIIDINYSAGTNKVGRELAIFSDNLIIPT
ncbi:DNA adenine methylase [Aequitasia blattaphilus]|uniref:site-specific DNA-methyltransferase (adenine-specific) n=1 Tax=Aequitasia blattaphilus TaxID=2949332 RepID=A0ABT1ECB2_9FIRM|nr:DNA adenine methylase [Aequitasia blattaphilus]MCP1103486.1 DNA adenine methylase [Aequitasia blattaphilus]MCR8616126.1 DNA adenine methylase [Aequitasia blattaphilus]